MKPLVYLKKVLNFSFAEWNSLTAEDKDDLIGWANVEMTARGITIAA